MQQMKDNRKHEPTVVPGDQVIKDTEKAKVLNAFFALDFTRNICLQDSQARENIWNKEDISEGESD